MLPAAEHAISPTPGTHETIMEGAGDQVARVSGLAVARLDEATGEIVIPTPITDGFLRFDITAKLLDEKQFAVLGPLGMRRDYAPAAVAHFLQDALRRGFDPYSGEIFLLRYWTSQGPQYTHHIGIHGMRRHVVETGTYRGLKPVLYAGDDGKWRDIWPYQDAVPYVCRAQMVHTEWDELVQMDAYYDEFVPMIDEKDAGGAKTGQKVPAPMWRPGRQGGKGNLMLSKVTRAQTFREGWPAQLTGWFEPTEFERNRVESDALLEGIDQTRAQRREAEYQQSRRRRTVDGAALGVVVTETAGDDQGDGPTTMPGDRVRSMLLAELDAQATIIGKSRDFVAARWESTRGGRQFAQASIGEIAALVANCRGYVTTVLREQGRHEMAERYAEWCAAPNTRPGTLLELFGVADLDALTGDVRTEAAA